MDRNDDWEDAHWAPPPPATNPPQDAAPGLNFAAMDIDNQVNINTEEESSITLSNSSGDNSVNGEGPNVIEEFNPGIIMQPVEAPQAVRPVQLDAEDIEPIQ